MITRVAPLALATCVLLAACGGGDDDDSSDTTPTTSDAPVVTTATTVAEATTTTEAVETTTTVAMVVEGATVLVANSSIVGGSAGRMTDELAGAGFTTATPTNGTDKLEDSIVHYTDDEGAQEVAESLAAKLGGVEVSAMPDPIPTEDGELGGAQVLLLLGNNQADRTLDELSGAATVETDGSVVVVANVSGVSGSAGRMTATLDRAGFAVGEPTNGVEQLADSIVHYTDTEGAQEDAETLAEAMGGLEVSAMPDPIPTEDGELDGDVLLLLGTNQADQTLDELNP